MDVHQKFVVATIAVTDYCGVTSYIKKRFTTFNFDLQALKKWFLSHNCTVILKPAQAVVSAGDNNLILPVLIHGFFANQVSEYVISTRYLPPVLVDMQGQIAFFVIPKSFYISCSIDLFMSFNKAVVLALNGFAFSSKIRFACPNDVYSL